MRDIEKNLTTANMQSKTGFPSSHQLKSRLKLAARSPVSGCWPSCCFRFVFQPKMKFHIRRRFFSAENIKPVSGRVLVLTTVSSFIDF